MFTLALAFGLATFLVAGPGACSRGGDSDSVVLYSSVDEEIARPILDEFQKRTRIRVLLVGDTEATKTTGLVQRLLAEKDSPQADVWWSSEALGTVRLAAAGVLAPYVSLANESDLEAQGGPWPPELRGTDRNWYGFALRARVFVYDKNKVAQGDIPRALAQLSAPRFKGRIGMARPEFGTTRGHLSALRTIVGDKAVEAWLADLEANGVRWYDGNAAVVRGISLGEIEVGLTDTDDVWAGKANGWPVEAAFEQLPEPGSGGPGANAALGSIAGGTGTILVPNTVALVRGARHLRNAGLLIDYLLSAEVESALAKSISGNYPIRPDLAKRFPMPKTARLIDWEGVAERESSREQ